MKFCRKIDNEGLFIEDVLLDEIPYIYDEEFNKVYDNHYIEVPVPQGFYRPKWNGSEWIEGLSEEEIQEIKNQVQEPTELEKLIARQNATEDALLFLMDGGIS